MPCVLASVHGLAHEVIVLDTGSTDATVDVVQKRGARVEHFNWVDDFSAAHNYCFQFATGNWVLWLDADEELLPQSKSEIRRCMERDDTDGFFVKRQDLRDLNQLDDFSVMWQLRLIRRSAHPQFVGRFHHHFDPPLKRVRQSEIMLRHYGYIGELLPAKNKRAAHLLALELQDRPGQFYYLVEYARTLLSLQDEKAIAVFAEAAEMVRDGAPQARGAPLALLLEWVLATPQLADDFPLTKHDAARIAKQKFPTAIPLLWHLAQAEHQAGRFDKCAALLEKIIHLGQTQTYDMLVSFDPSIMGNDAMLNLGVCYTRMAELKKAEKCFKRLLRSRTHGDRAAANLRAVRELRGR